MYNGKKSGLRIDPWGYSTSDHFFRWQLTVDNALLLPIRKVGSKLVRLHTNDTKIFIHLGYQDVMINGIERFLDIQEYDTFKCTIILIF